VLIGTIVSPRKQTLTLETNVPCESIHMASMLKQVQETPHEDSVVVLMECPYCDRRFELKQSLNRHLKVASEWSDKKKQFHPAAGTDLWKFSSCYRL